MITSPRLGQLALPRLSGATRWGGTLGVIAAAAALLTGLAVALGPEPTALVSCGIALGWLVLIGRAIKVVFLGALGVLLVAYAFFDRGIAHVGIGPVYVGELVLILAVPATVIGLARARLSVVHLALLVFMIWGAARTVPYINQYGIDALRDSVTWSYGFFAIAVSVTLGAEHLSFMVRAYRRLVPMLVVWVPMAALLTSVAGSIIPTLPGSDVPLIYVKAGDAGVMLAGVAAFMLTGLFAWGRTRSALQEGFVWLFWLAGFAFTAAANRGGMLAASMAVFSGLFVRRLTRWLLPLSIGVMVLSAAWLANPQIDLGARSLSIDQLAQNVTSIFTNANGTETQATKEWRLAWWDKIIGYTIDGPYFWTGKGYGINLADADGFQVNSDGSLRAPHSTHFEILARSGVPGLVSWAVLQAVFGMAMLLAAFRAYRARSNVLLALIAWSFVYWLAALVNSSFDVYLGGPQGGIPFWADIGFGIVLCRLAADGVRLDLERVAPGRRDGPPAGPPASGDAAEPRLAATVGGRPRRAKARWPPHDRHQEPGDHRDVAPPQAARLTEEPVGPFESRPLHPARRLGQRAGMDVEGGAHAKEDRGLQPARMRGHPALLLGRR